MTATLDTSLALLAEVTGAVESARSMPMSASCVVNRTEVLALLEDLRESLPAELHRAREVLGDREGVVEDGRLEAAQVVEQAREERRRLLSDTDIVQEAQREAGLLVEQARRQAEDMRAEVEDYVDAKLANFEVVLAKTMEAVERGRQKLSGRQEVDALRQGALDEDDARADSRA